jgi:hypothetical protein
VEAAPPLLPVALDGRRGDVGVPERRAQALLARRPGVDGELDRLSLDLLEPVREELDEDGSRLLDGRPRDRDRDPPQPPQRKALFSFSKNPSSAR